MALLVKGTAGCRKEKDGSWTAYMPAETENREYSLQLSEKDKPLPNAGRFDLVKDGEIVASCDFPDSHRYMTAYKDMLRAIEQSKAMGKEIEPKMFEAAKVITKDGYEPVKKKKASLGLTGKNKGKPRQDGIEI